jgi:hypothetical protein
MTFGSLVARVMTSVVVLAIWGGIVTLASLPATIVAGQQAGQQFDNTDQGWYVSQSVFAAIRGSYGIVTFVFFLVLLAVWWGPVSRLWKRTSDEQDPRGPRTGLTVLFLVGSLALFHPAPAQAYYEDSDWSEDFFILPNESAFYIPDVGANKDSQAEFGSEKYLADNKIAAKRFNMPHVKLPNSGRLSNKVVPAGRLVIVGRDPYAREWVTAHDRGTSTKNEGFPCQSSEGIDAGVGVAIGANVTEANAAKFLYNFGVKPPVGDRTEPKVIFTSVYYGRNLAEVMDGPVRIKVQSLVCDELMARSVVQINKDMVIMRGTIEGKIKAYMDGVGITLSFFGWADTVDFKPSIQDAIKPQVRG